ADPLAHSTRTETARRDAVWNRQLADLGAPPEVSTPRQTDLVRFDRGETIDIVLDDGQRLDLPGWNLRALWTPGHTAGHVCFVDEERSEEHTSELQSRFDLVCRLLLEKKKE